MQRRTPKWTRSGACVRAIAASVTGAALLVSLGACNATFSERHYFASRDKNGNIVNYYRVSVEGRVDGGDARYVSGYFDEKAVEAYFGEYTQPQTGSFLSEGDSAAGREVGPLDPSKQGRQLVMILSSNSDEIANQIGALANTEEIAGSIAMLAGGERLKASHRAGQEARIDAGRFATLAAHADAVFSDLSDDATQAKLRSTLLPLVNATARRLGATKDFTTFADAEAWLDGLKGDAP